MISNNLTDTNDRAEKDALKITERRNSSDSGSPQHQQEKRLERATSSETFDSLNKY